MTPMMRRVAHGSASVAGAIAIAIAVVNLAVWEGGLSSAAADPGPPADPLIPAPAPQNMIGQALAQLTPSSPLNALNDLPAVLGQGPLAPGTVGIGAAPDPLALAQALMPQNYRMPTPDQNSPYALAPNTAPSPFARIDAWKGVHALLHGGLGRMPGDELGQPLPGTAPPPDSNIPPGLEQFYIPPAPAG